MTVLTLTITDAGRNALVNAANTGTLPLVLDKVVLGRACYVPTAVQQALHDPIKPLSTFGGSQVADDTIHITITDDSHDAYSLGEMGLYSGGVLFAVYSQALPILEKGPEQMVLLSADIQFLSLPANSVTVGSTEFAYPQGNELRPGVLEIATPDEATTGKDHTRAITPLTLKQGLDTKLGKLEAAVAAAKWSTARQFVISGDGSGMALMDGSGNVVLQLEVNDNSHGHTIENVSGLATALSNKLAATANAVSASRWATYRLFKISGNANGQVYLDGSGDVELNLRVTSADAATILDGGTIKAKGQDLTIWDKRAMVGANSANQLIINYAGDWGSTQIQGQTYLQTVESNRHVVVHNGSTNYTNSGLEVRSTDGSATRIGFHQSGVAAGAINFSNWGFQFEREAGLGSRANIAAANFFADAAQDMTGNALTRLDYVGANFLKYRNRLHPDDGTSLDNVNREYGFNYSTGGGLFGPYISFGGLGGNYECQINADFPTGNNIAFRTHNGDSGRWNQWNTIWSSGNFDPATKLDNNGSGGTLYLSSWFRSTGNTGWFSETHGGGIYMQDATYVRTYGGRRFFVDNTESDAIRTDGGVYSNSRVTVVADRWLSEMGGTYEQSRYSGSPVDVPFLNGIPAGNFAPFISSYAVTQGNGYTTRVKLGMLTSAGNWAKANLFVGGAEGSSNPMANYTFDIHGNVAGINRLDAGYLFTERADASVNLELKNNTNYPGLAFHRPGQTWAEIRHNGGEYYMQGDGQNFRIGNDMYCSYAYANGAQPQVANALTRKDYVDDRDWYTRWENKLVPNHDSGDANAHYNSEWDGSGVANAPSAEWHFFRDVAHSGGGVWNHQEAFAFFSDEEYFRRGLGSAGSHGPWRRRWHSGNFDPASKSDTGHGHAAATQAAAGFMSAVDKIRLDNIAKSKSPAEYTLWSGEAGSSTTSISVSQSLANFNAIRWEGYNADRSITWTYTMPCHEWVALCASGLHVNISAGSYYFTFKAQAATTTTMTRHTNSAYLTRIVGIN